MWAKKQISDTKNLMPKYIPSGPKNDKAPHLQQKGQLNSKTNNKIWALEHTKQHHSLTFMWVKKWMLGTNNQCQPNCEVIQ